MLYSKGRKWRGWLVPVLSSFFLFLFPSPARAQTLIINEFMQSNIDCLWDDRNEFPDSWVELYNPGTTAINLGLYSIGPSTDPSLAWQLPARTVGPKQRVVVYCDKEATGLHTDFRLDSGKDMAIRLFAVKKLVDEVVLRRKQPAPNIAYGRATDGAEEWGYQLTPTPGTANTGGVCDHNHLLPDPIFSEPGMVITDNRKVTLKLSMPEGVPEGAHIYFTTNGQEPTAQSSRYINPINISVNRVVRAKIICEGWLSPRSRAESYLYFNRKPTLPIISISIDNSYLNDNKRGIYVDGTYNSQKKNYEYNWRRPMQLQFFERDNEPSVLNQLCETRIAGGATRTAMMKSLAIYANKRFGTKRFQYEFFPDQRPGVTDFKSLVLRNAGNDFDYLYQRDAIIQRSMAPYADIDWQAWRPAIVFINGVYKGMLNIRERGNESNIYTNYDGLENVDVVENWGELKEGTLDHLNAFKEFYAEHGHTLEEYAKWLDWEEFLNVMILNLYYNNQDFPGNNFMLWRPRTTNGRWRVIVKDTDFGLGLYGSPSDYKTFEWLYNPDYDAGRNWANQYEHTRLFRRLMEDADFHREFIDRTLIYMGDFLNETRVRELWDQMYEQIKTEYPNHRKLVNQWWPNYNDELGMARQWLHTRGGYYYTQLHDYYNLTTLRNLTLAAETASADQQPVLTFNGIRLSRPAFKGRFPEQRHICLEAKDTEGRPAAGWKVVSVSTNGVVTNREVAGPVLDELLPVCSSFTATAFWSAESGIEAPTQSEASWQWTLATDGQLLVTGLADRQVVSLYSMDGRLLSQQQAASGSAVFTLPHTQQLLVLSAGGRSVKIAR